MMHVLQDSQKVTFCIKLIKLCYDAYRYV